MAWLRTCGLAEARRASAITGKLLHDGGMSRNVGHRGCGSEAQTSVVHFDTMIEKVRKAHQPARSPYVFLQQLHHVGAAGDVLDARIRAAGLRAKSKRSAKIARSFQA